MPPGQSTARLVAYGAETPRTVEELEALADAIDAQPPPFVDGVVIDVGLSQQTFTPTASSADAAMIARLRAPPFDTLEHSLILVEVRPGDIDWFDPAHADAIEANLARAGAAVSDANARGLFLDTQAYAEQLFSAPDVAPGRTFAELEQRVREVARRAFTAYFASAPGTALLLTLGIADVWRAVCVEGIPLAQERYGLLPAFLEEALAAAAPSGGSVIDGFLPGYPLSNERQYAFAFQLMRRESALEWQAGFVTYRWPRDPANESGEYAWPAAPTDRCTPQERARFGTRLVTGMALMLDFQQDGPFQTDPARFAENRFTPAELRSNLAAMLEGSEGYVWLFWGGVDAFARPTSGLTPLPAAYQDAIRQARIVVADGE